MALKRGGRLLPLTYIFGSFFGAVMVAAVFAYNNYRFSQYKFVNFSDLYLYDRSAIFTPKNSKYFLLFFSSNQMNLNDLLQKITTKSHIIAIDILQKRGKSDSALSVVSSDINTILKLLNTFSITELPSGVEIEKISKETYKQTSKIIKF